MPNQNEQMNHQFQQLEENPFSQYYNLLGSGNNFDQITSSAAVNDWEYGYGNLQGFEEEQELFDDEQQKVGHGKEQNKAQIGIFLIKLFSFWILIFQI